MSIKGANGLQSHNSFYMLRFRTSMPSSQRSSLKEATRCLTLLWKSLFSIRA